MNRPPARPEFKNTSERKMVVRPCTLQRMQPPTCSHELHLSAASEDMALWAPLWPFADHGASPCCAHPQPQPAQELLHAGGGCGPAVAHPRDTRWGAGSSRRQEGSPDRAPPRGPHGAQIPGVRCANPHPSRPIERHRDQNCLPDTWHCTSDCSPTTEHPALSRPCQTSHEQPTPGRPASTPPCGSSGQQPNLHPAHGPPPSAPLLGVSRCASSSRARHSSS